MRTLFDFIFPPLCISCKEESFTQTLCSSCWSYCTPPDPVHRCRHCFEEIDHQEICSRCIKSPDFFFPRAHVFEPCDATFRLVSERLEDLAGYVLYQWIQLDWPRPDFILSFPQCKSNIGETLSQWLEIPFIRPFKWWSRKLIDEIVPEGATLLIWDTGVPIEILKRYEIQIAETFPKKCFLLSLFPLRPVC